MTSVPEQFTPLQRALHWLMAACIIAMFFIGVGMVSTISPRYLPLITIHKTLGSIIFVLALVRLGVRARFGAPPLPADVPVPLKLAASLSHYVLYALMLAMPLLGWGLLSAANYPIVLWGGLRLPHIVPASDSLHTLLWGAHVYLAFAFYALVLLHLSGALFHALVRRDGVFAAMAPVRSSNKSIRSG